MNEAKDIILIPHWIHETLTRHKRPIEDALDFATIRKIVSADDLVGWVMLNRAAHHVGLGRKGQECSLSHLETFWSYGSTKSVINEDAEYYYGVIQRLAMVPGAKAELHDRLFAPESATNWYEEPFNIYDLAQQFVGVVVYPGFFTGEEGSQQAVFSLVEAIVKALYVNAPLAEVARTPVFLRYLDLLSEKRIVV